MVHRRDKPQRLTRAQELELVEELHRLEDLAYRRLAVETWGAAVEPEPPPEPGAARARWALALRDEARVNGSDQVRALLAEADGHAWALALTLTAESEVQARAAAKNWLGATRNRVLSEADLVVYGLRGAFDAALSFAPSVGVRFSTYGSVHVCAAQRRFAERLVGSVTLPRSVLRRVRIAARAERAAQAAGHTLTGQALATEAGWTCASATLALTYARGGFAAAPMPLQLVPAPLGELADREMVGRLLAAVDALPAREAEAIRRRFGLAGFDAHTQQEVAAALGLSRTRTRQILTDAMRGLRATVRS